MAASGQTLGDRLNAFRYALAGQGLARTVCKATTLEILAPKRKHMDYLIACTNEPNISIPQLANLLIERTQHSNWAVVFKALISIHHLMSYGNERFTQYLATSNHTFELPDFLDRTNPQGYNMSSFVRRYAKYVDHKSISYRALAIDLCKIKSGNDNALRTMNMDNLSKSIPILQKQFDSLLEFEAEAKDLNNGIIMSAFRLLYKDLVRIYVAYQEAIINLLERYFKLSRKKTREALEMYKNYLARMDKVDSFLRVVEAVELDKSEMPDLKNSPASILKLLEQHLAQLEARKKGSTTPALEDQGEPEKTADGEEHETPVTAASTAASERPAVVVKGGDDVENKVSEESNIHQPPPKPARPSPKASPAVSPKSSPVAAKPAPPRPPPGSSTSPKPTISSTRKGPPERPAKPPSRPPPPSAVSPATSAPDKPERTASEAKSNSESHSIPHAPPPHPPPPTNHQLHSTPESLNTSPINPPETTRTSTDDTSISSSQPSIVAREVNGAPEAPSKTPPTSQLPVSDGHTEDEQSTASACGSTANQTVLGSQQSALEAPDVETRSHVQMNNVDHGPTENGHGEEISSPASVLEEEGPGEEVALDSADVLEEQVDEQPVEVSPEPVTNGETSADQQTG